MQGVRAITTCSAIGWQQYGRRMVQTWLANWPVPLTVWVEGFSCDLPGVGIRDLAGVQWLTDFKRANKHRPTDNYRMDSVRFAHKTASVIESALEFDCEHLIWVDADTVTHSTVPEVFVQSLLPRDHHYIAWLDRVGNYPECGFYALNMRYPTNQMLMRLWRSWYTSGSVFELKEWHDSFVLQQLIERTDSAWKSLSGPQARGCGHPFINGPLGAYMDHLKGPRKIEGKSRRKDLKIHRTEKYWSTR